MLGIGRLQYERPDGLSHALILSIAGHAAGSSDAEQ